MNKQIYGLWGRYPEGWSVVARSPDRRSFSAELTGAYGVNFGRVFIGVVTGGSMHREFVGRSVHRNTGENDVI